jgi:hypothetical protein
MDGCIARETPDCRDPPELLRACRAEVEADLAGIQHRLLEHRANPHPPCVALTRHLRLMPDGSVPTCQMNSTRVGSLLEQEFRQLWHSGKTREMRDWVRKCPGCWAECEVLPSALYTGDLLRELVRGPGVRMREVLRKTAPV